jgi:hypothetical protein
VYVPKSNKAQAARLIIPITAIGYVISLTFFIGSIAACGNDLGTLPNTGQRPTLGLVVDPDSPTDVESGTNHVLELAQIIEGGGEPRLITGTISGPGDIDVFDLGPVQPGDRVRVEVDADGQLQGVLGLFDDTGCTLLINDHRNVYLGRQGPFIDVTVRRASASCLIAFAATPGFSAAGGSYQLSTAIEFPATIPSPRPDVFVLDFQGGRNVRIGNRSAVNVPAFDAASILLAIVLHFLRAH